MGGEGGEKSSLFSFSIILLSSLDIRFSSNPLSLVTKFLAREMRKRISFLCSASHSSLPFSLSPSLL